MNHWTARQLLPAILDHTIPAGLEAEVRDHVDGCGRCRRTLAEFEASDLPARAFGDEVSRHLLHFARSEQRYFDRAVTDWERARYLERI